MAKKEELEKKQKMGSEKKNEEIPPEPQSFGREFDPYQVLRQPLSTEKSIGRIEFGNCLVFAVHPGATKEEVKKAVEELLKVKVLKVNIHNSFQGGKRAYVRLKPGYSASDVSADLGLI